MFAALLIAFDSGHGYALADGSAVAQEYSYGNDTRQVLDLYLPDSAPIRSTVIFFYGGMWLGGHKADYAFMGQSLAKRGFAVIIPDYRLYPKVQYPAIFDDAASVVRWAHDQAGLKGTRLYLTGYSSGAYMASMLATNPRYLATAGLATNVISGVIGLGGFYNLLPAQRPEIRTIFASATDQESLNAANMANTGEPPMLLLAGRKNDSTDFAEASAFAAHLQAKGGRARVIGYDDLGHVGVMLPFSPLFHNESTVVDDVADFLSGKTQ